MLLSSYMKLMESTPFKVIREHVKIVTTCASQLASLFEGISNDDFEVIRIAHEKIIQTEHEADLLKRQLRQDLSKNLMLPVDRADVLQLIVLQDGIANITKDISGLLVERKMKFPKGTEEAWLTLCRGTIDTCIQAKNMIKQLNVVVETGFSADRLENIQEMLKDLDDKEHETDLLQSKVRRLLFECEADFSPIDMVFFYHINHQLGLISDVCQNIGARFLLMVSI